MFVHKSCHQILYIICFRFFYLPYLCFKKNYCNHKETFGQLFKSFYIFKFNKALHALNIPQRKAHNYLTIAKRRYNRTNEQQFPFAPLQADTSACMHVKHFFLPTLYISIRIVTNQQHTDVLQVFKVNAKRNYHHKHQTLKRHLYTIELSALCCLNVANKDSFHARHN